MFLCCWSCRAAGRLKEGGGGDGLLVGPVLDAFGGLGLRPSAGLDEVEEGDEDTLAVGRVGAFEDGFAAVADGEGGAGVAIGGGEVEGGEGVHG